MIIEQSMEKLSSPIFEAFSKSVDKQYIYICDVKTNMWHWSQYAVECFGLPGEYIQDFPNIWLQKVHPEDRYKLTAEFSKLFSGESLEHSCEYRVLNAQGNYMWINCRGCMVLDKDGALDLCAGILTDLGSKSKFDTTTGLYSFTEFRSAISKILLSPQNHGGVLLWGIDHFRRINDEKQYAFGNELLKAYAKRILAIMPADYEVYRMDGDQFAVVCPDIDSADLILLFNRILALSVDGIKVNGKKQRFSISGGAVTYPENGDQTDSIYTSLEYALETSKKHKREGLTFFTEHLQQESLRLFQMQQRLRESVIDNCNGFYLCYQPLVSPDSDKQELVGAEALLRWTNPEFPSVGPVDFIPLLEESGDINIVGKWVLSTALAQMQEWLKKRPNMKISVNVSYLQLKDSNFKDYVLQELDKYHFPKKQLVLELTESCNVINPKELAKELDFFRKHGIQIALDDFGTGYASLSILRDLSADWIKIDHTFVAQIANSKYDKALTEYLISLCKTLGLSVCVEGIETKEIQTVIKQYNPTVMQGYFYSRPVESKIFESNFINRTVQ